MKTQNLFLGFFVILIITGFSINAVAAQNKKKDYTEQVYNLSPTGTFILLSSHLNIKILTWDRNEVKVNGEITYDENVSQEEMDKLLAAFKNMKTESSPDILKLDLCLVKNFQSDGGIFKKKQILTLYDGEELSIGIDKFHVAYTIWIPKTINIQSNNKYGRLEMESVDGNVDLTMYHNDLIMAGYGESGIFNIKYSSTTIGNGGNATFKVYHGTINAGEMKNVAIDANYSNIVIEKAHDVSLKSYHDTYVFGRLNNIDASAQYTTIHIKNAADKSQFNLYHSDFFGKKFQVMEVSSAQYSKFSIDSIGEITINKSYHSEFNLTVVNTFLCGKSQYDAIKIDKVMENVSFPKSYHTTIKINGTGESFKGFSGNFQYGRIDMIIHPDVAYNLNYEGTYGSLNTISPDRFTKFVSDKTNSKTTIIGSTTDAECNIELITHSVACKIE